MLKLPFFEVEIKIDSNFYKKKKKRKVLVLVKFTVLLREGKQTNKYIIWQMVIIAVKKNRTG